MMEINLLLDLLKLMSLMVIPCSQECHLLTSEVTNMHELADENVVDIFECVCELVQGLCSKHALQILLFLWGACGNATKYAILKIFSTIFKEVLIVCRNLTQGVVGDILKNLC